MIAQQAGLKVYLAEKFIAGKTGKLTVSYRLPVFPAFVAQKFLTARTETTYY
jgi:hypothetical protein